MDFTKMRCPNCDNPSFPDERYHDMTEEEDKKIRYECHDCWEDFPKSKFTETIGTIEFSEEESDEIKERIDEDMDQDDLLEIVKEVKGEEAIKEAIGG